MRFLRDLLEREPQTTDGPDQPVEWHGSSLILAKPPDPHTHHDYLGNPVHDWTEKRVTAIWATCNNCGRTELRPNHRGPIKGTKRKRAK